jgi:hypothetical protein
VIASDVDDWREYIAMDALEVDHRNKVNMLVVVLFDSWNRV